MENTRARIADKGTYILIFRMVAGQRISIGRLGEYRFDKGVYCYVGSAFGSGGLKARLRHHANPSPSPRWHIDYLKNAAALKQILFTCSADHLEHRWAEILLNMDKLEPAVNGFGSSDCNCRTHLFFNRDFPLTELAKIMKQRLPADIPAITVYYNQMKKLIDS